MLVYQRVDISFQRMWAVGQLFKNFNQNQLSRHILLGWKCSVRHSFSGSHGPVTESVLLNPTLPRHHPQTVSGIQGLVNVTPHHPPKKTKTDITDAHTSRN